MRVTGGPWASADRVVMDVVVVVPFWTISPIPSRRAESSSSGARKSYYCTYKDICITSTCPIYDIEDCIVKATPGAPQHHEPPLSRLISQGSPPYLTLPRLPRLGQPTGDIRVTALLMLPRLSFFSHIWTPTVPPTPPYSSVDKEAGRDVAKLGFQVVMPHLKRGTSGS